MNNSSELPAGWVWTTLDELAHIGTGTTPSRGNTLYWVNGSIPWVTSSAVNQYTVLNSDEKITPKALQETTIRVYQKNTLILALYGEGKTRGKVSELLIDATLNQALAAIVLRENATSCRSYVKAFLLSNYVELRRKAAGGMQPNLNLSIVKQIRVPLAPSEEQCRIVERIDELLSDLDAGVAGLERARANLKKYRAAVLKAAVTGDLTAEWRAAHPNIEPAREILKRIDPPPRPARYASKSKDVIPGHAALSVGATGASLPPKWVWSPLVDVARMESGHTPSRNHPEWWDGDVAWVGILDAKAHHGGLINETIQHTNAEGLANSAARLLPAGTVCISRTAASIGYVMVLGRPMATSQDFVNWVPTEAVRSDWLRVVFMVDREVLIRFGKGSTHKTVYFPEWLSLHVAVPPLAEQEEIAVEVERHLSIISATADYIDASLKRATRLRQSILKEAFAGRLVPQDAKDEPATVLLDRIRQQRITANGATSVKRPKTRKGPKSKSK